MKGKLS